MPRAMLVPINGTVLAWAMEQAGVDDLELADRVGTSPDVIEQCRVGEAQPSKTQFRRLVSRLRRPSSIYFLAEPPEHDPALRAFRSPPRTTVERHLLDEELRAIQTVERLQRWRAGFVSQRGDDPVDLPPVGQPNQTAAELRATREFLDRSGRSTVWGVVQLRGGQAPSRAP
jgi:hypothetical protein